MSEVLYRLAKRIRDSQDDLEIVLQRIEEGWKKYQRSMDDYYLDGVALNLHGFYSGLERIFELIAITVDGTIPEGEHWHKALLQQMTRQISSIRPAVISEYSFEQLDDYRGFRHIVRNVYTYKFDPEKVNKLVEKTPYLSIRLIAELQAFADFLDQE
jgi:hypothetical protein